MQLIQSFLRIAQSLMFTIGCWWRVCALRPTAVIWLYVFTLPPDAASDGLQFTLVVAACNRLEFTCSAAARTLEIHVTNVNTYVSFRTICVSLLIYFEILQSAIRNLFLMRKLWDLNCFFRFINFDLLRFHQPWTHLGRTRIWSILKSLRILNCLSTSIWMDVLI